MRDSAYTTELENNVKLLGTIDFIFAKAMYGISINGISPLINNEKKSSRMEALNELIELGLINEDDSIYMNDVLKDVIDAEFAKRSYGVL